MRGDGRIFLRGTTYWCAYNLRGIEHRESTGTSDEKQAGKFLKARLREVGADLLGARTFVTPKASRLTVAELCDALKADFELRGKASMQNLSHLKRVETDFGTCRAVELSSEKVDSYIEERLADGDRPATVNRTLQMLGQSFALAIRRGHLSKAPYIRHLSEAGNARQGFFTEQELAAVISHLPADLRDFVRFAAATGMRKGELASVTWSDIHGDVLTLRGENSKNGESRNIPLVGELAQIVERRNAARQVENDGYGPYGRIYFPSQRCAGPRVSKVMGDRVPVGEGSGPTLPRPQTPSVPVHDSGWRAPSSRTKDLWP